MLVNCEPWSECTSTRFFGFRCQNGSQQGLQNHVGCLAALHRPAHDPAREEIEDDREVSEALVGADIGDVGHPCPVRCLHIELAIQRVVDSQ